MSEEIEEVPSLCWSVPVGDKLHDYEMGFGWMNGQPMAVLFCTIADSEGVSSDPRPVAFLPQSVLAQAADDGWYTHDFDL